MCQVKTLIFVQVVLYRQKFNYLLTTNLNSLKEKNEQNLK